MNEGYSNCKQCFKRVDHWHAFQHIHFSNIPAPLTTKEWQLIEAIRKHAKGTNGPEAKSVAEQIKFGTDSYPVDGRNWCWNGGIRAVIKEFRRILNSDNPRNLPPFSRGSLACIVNVFGDLLDD